VIERATKLLAPNLMISRHYVNVENGQTVGLLVVHCGDAHDMVGHYPVQCSRADGWNLTTAKQASWHIGERTFNGMEYSFVLPPASRNEVAHTITIDNFLLRPNNKIMKDMDELSAAIIGAAGQAAGAGQIQVSFYDSTLTAEERHAIVEEILSGYRPVIDAILAEIPS